MIRLTDAAVLAYTKLRTRKIRLIITTVISGLLFTALAAASLIGRGAFHSVDSFTQEGFGRRYLVMAVNSPQKGGEAFADPTTLVRAEALHKDLVARKKASAKKLGIEYDEKTENPAVTEFDGPSGKLRTLDPSNPGAQQALAEAAKAQAVPGEPELRKLAEPYKPRALYTSMVRSGMFGGPSTGTLQLLKDGKESFERNNSFYSPSPTGLDSFVSGWALMSQDMLKPFTLPNQSLALGKDGSVPVLAPYTAVEQLLKLTPLPGGAGSKAKLDRLKEVRARAAGQQFSVCYRNATSAADVDKTIAQAQEIIRNKDNKEFQKPELEYDLPASPCAAVRTKRDVRSADAKKLDAKWMQFRQEFGEPASSSANITFRIVGVVPDPPDMSASVVSQVLGSIMTSTIGSGWYTPYELKAQNPLLATNFPETGIPFGPPVHQYFIEFAHAPETRRFLDEQSCYEEDVTAGPTQPGVIEIHECKKDGKVFGLSSFGSSSLAVDSAQKLFGRGFQAIALGVAIFAGLIMIATVGRIIADSRRETAVFRAIGAKRLDIAQIYFTYILYLSALIGVFALGIGMIVARVVDSRLSEQVTVDALVIYNASDLSRRFSFFSLNPRDLLYLVGLILLAGFISAAIPLLTNLRRNPIKDMRDER